MNYNINCELCDKEYNNDSALTLINAFERHISSSHKILKSNYVRLYEVDKELLCQFKHERSVKGKLTRNSPEGVLKSNNKLLRKISIDEYNKLPKCGICGLVDKQLFKHIVEVHKISVGEYKAQYNDHVCTPEYLEYLSDTRKGINNPMFGKSIPENSPYSEAFYTSRGLTIEESKIKLTEMKQKISDVKTPESEPTHFEYYMKQFGVSEQEARKMLKDRQSTNSVKNIAKRNNISEIDAQVIRDNITDKWMNTLSLKTTEELVDINRKKTVHCVSGASINFFDRLLIELKDDVDTTTALYNTNEMYLSYESNSNTRFYLYDFVIGNKIIEFNGDIYHGTPDIYTPESKPMARLKQTRNPTAQELWDYDKKKIDLAISNRYEILVVWEKDVKSDLINEINRCKEFVLIDNKRNLEGV